MIRLAHILVILAIASGCDARATLPAAKETTMSLSLHFHTCNLSDDTREATNPFTNEKTFFHVDDGLSESERKAVLDLLRTASASEPDPDGYYYVDLPDGARVGVGASTLSGSDKCVAFAVECNNLTDAAADFLFRLSRAGNMSVGSSVNPDVVAFTAQPNDKVVVRWPKAPLLPDSASLAAWLTANCN